LRFVPAHWHCPCLQKKNKKKRESKRARGQEKQM
jgi:hypothetical protein